MHQTSALYDPRNHQSPSQREAIKDALQRRMRLKAAVAARKQKAAEVHIRKIVPAKPNYSVMWFYNLVFETERKLPAILAEAKKMKAPKVGEIQNAVSNFYGVKVHDLTSARRTGELIHPRQVAVYLAKTLTPHSYPEIGRRFGNRDHTTMLYSFRKIDKMIKSSADVRDEVNAITKSLGVALA